MYKLRMDYNPISKKSRVSVLNNNFIFLLDETEKGFKKETSYKDEFKNCTKDNLVKMSLLEVFLFKVFNIIPKM